MPGFLHETAIQALEKRTPGFKRRGLMREINLLTNDEFHGALCRFIPDGFRLSLTKEQLLFEDKLLVVDLYEVEHGKPVSSNKMKNMLEWYYEMDCCRAFYCNLHLVDKWGAERTCIDDEMMQTYLRQLLIEKLGAKGIASLEAERPDMLPYVVRKD
jgi:hypothetical protein